MTAYVTLPTTNVRLEDIRDTLSTNGGSVGNIVGSFFKPAARVNQWSLNKPLSGGADFYATTAAFQEYAKTVYCGLTPQVNSYLREANVNYSGTKVGHSLSEVQAANKEWAYNRPTARPFRVGDFRGYRADAIPPDGNYQDYDLLSTTLTTIAGLDVRSEATTSGMDWYLSNDSKSYRLSGFSLKYGLQSWEGVNQSSLIDIPISYIQGNINTEYWRFGLAVQISTLATDAQWQLFVSDHTFSRVSNTSRDTKYILPDMATNQQAVQQMINSANVEFPYVPCLVKNCYLGFDGAGQSYVYLTGDSAVYSAPSGSYGFKFTKSTPSAPNPLVNGKWSVKSRFTGKYVQFGEETYTRVPINELVVMYDGTLSSATDIDVQIAYSYLSGTNNVTNATRRVTTTFAAGVSELSIYGAPGLTVSKTGTEWYKP